MKTKATALVLAILMGTSTILNGLQTTVFAQEAETVLEKNIAENEENLENGSIKNIKENAQTEQERPDREKKEETTLTESEENISENSAPINDITTDVKEETSDNYIEEVNTDDVVQIPDARLKAALNNVLKQESDAEITISQMQSISYLDLANRGITNLEGLQYCTNLTDLIAIYNNITDLTPISKLKKLRNLDVYNNKITFLPDISEMESLSIFRVHDNEISDISLLSNGIPSSLYILGLGKNNISDISALSEFNPLEFNAYRTQLGLEYNNISDISPLKNKDFQNLNLTSNCISDLSQFKKYDIKYKFLRIENQNITQNVTINNLDNVEVNNILIDPDGNPLTIDQVNQDGVYNQLDNMILWNKIDLTNDYKYTFLQKYIQGLGWNYSANVNVKFTIQQENSAPIINATDKVLTVGDTFNPLDGVTAHDTENGYIKLTEDNIIANNVDMSKAGKYSITYKVTDSKGASTVKTITVTVNEKATIPVEKPSQNGNSNTNISNPNKLPQTGDASNLGLLGLMFAGSGGMLLGLNRKKKK